MGPEQCLPLRLEKCGIRGYTARAPEAAEWGLGASWGITVQEPETGCLWSILPWFDHGLAVPSPPCLGRQNSTSLCCELGVWCLGLSDFIESNAKGPQ